MAGRYDKYDPISGGFRAPLDADVDAADTPLGVGLNSDGEVVAGAGNTGVVGVLWISVDKKAGDKVDVMTAGEMVEGSTTRKPCFSAKKSLAEPVTR